jgi:hypothetical protein
VRLRDEEVQRLLIPTLGEPLRQDGLESGHAAYDDRQFVVVWILGTAGHSHDGAPLIVCASAHFIGRHETISAKEALKGRPAAGCPITALAPKSAIDLRSPRLTS